MKRYGTKGFTAAGIISVKPNEIPHPKTSKVVDKWDLTIECRSKEFHHSESG